MSDKVEQPLDYRGRRIWTNEVFPPPSRVDYTRIFAGVPNRAALIVGGLVVALLGFSLLVPIVLQLVLGISYLLRGRPGDYGAYSAQAISFAYPEGMFGTHLAIGLLIVVVMVATRYLHSRDPRWLMSVQPGMRWRYLIISTLVSILTLGGMFYVSGGFSFPTWNPQTNYALWMALIVVTAPIQAAGEEFLFRGYLMSVLGSFIPVKWAVVGLSALVFGAVHGTQNLPLFVNRVGFGLLAGALIVVTGGLEAAIAAHVANNLLAFGFAASSGGVAVARSLTEVTWTTTGWNLAGYALTALVVWGIGRLMNGATRTPYDPPAAV